MDTEKKRDNDLLNIFHSSTIKLGVDCCIKELAFLSKDKNKKAFYDKCERYLNKPNGKTFNASFIKRNSKNVFEFCRFLIREIAIEMNSNKDHVIDNLTERTMDISEMFLKSYFKNNAN